MNWDGLELPDKNKQKGEKVMWLKIGEYEFNWAILLLGLVALTLLLTAGLWLYQEDKGGENMRCSDCDKICRLRTGLANDKCRKEEMDNWRNEPAEVLIRYADKRSERTQKPEQVKIMIINRTWAMPNKNTFDCLPIGNFVRKYLADTKVSIDPFSRNNKWTTYTNDLDPNTSAECHVDARQYLASLIAQGITADLIILDPPYSQVQVSRAYNSVGKEYKPFGDDNNAVLYRQMRDLTNALLTTRGVVLSFGWNSGGMGKKRGYEILEVLLVCHGASHNDTICMAERKLSYKMQPKRDEVKV